MLAPQSAIDDVAASIGTRLVLDDARHPPCSSSSPTSRGRSILRTLGRLVDAANDLARGRLDRRVDVGGLDEFARLGRAFNEMADQLEARIHEFRRRAPAPARRDGALRRGACGDARRRHGVVGDGDGGDGCPRRRLCSGDNHEVVRKGNPDAGVRRLEFHLSAGEESFGRLVLTADSFRREQTETAEWFVSQARTASRMRVTIGQFSARLSSDSLTGLANRHASARPRSRRKSAERIDSARRCRRGRGHRRLQERERPPRAPPTGDEVLRSSPGRSRHRARDRPRRSLGRRGVRRRAPGHGSGGRRPLAERVRGALAQSAHRGAESANACALPPASAWPRSTAAAA